jgi:hypothetical protein
MMGKGYADNYSICFDQGRFMSLALEFFSSAGPV